MKLPIKSRLKGYNNLCLLTGMIIMKCITLNGCSSADVYEVQNGFFDYYNIHREDYPKNNLQQLPEDDLKAWKEAPIINHSYVQP